MALKQALLASIITIAIRALEVIAGEPIPKVATSWYAGYHSADFPVSEVSWSKYTHLTYAFAETTENATLDLSESNPEVLPVFVAEAHKHGVKALVSIGGWTGSRAYSYNVGSPSNRTTFVKVVTDFVQQYQLDGLDFDWEYPAKQGIGCNAINPQDTADFLLFLQELRQNPIGSKLILSAAVTISPFLGPDGAALTDVSGFSKVLDWIAIMGYDIWGPWTSAVGPNGPLNDTCAAPANQIGSDVSGVMKWINAGMPKNQIVLGIPAYGHSYEVPNTAAFLANSTTELAPYPSFNTSAHRPGDKWDDGSGPDVCGNEQTPGGTITYDGMFELGYLKNDGQVNDGIVYRYDECSQTPFVYNPTTEIMVSYDNPQSFGAKGEFIKDQDLLGFAMWEAGGDHNDLLLTAIRAAAGFPCDLEQSGHQVPGKRRRSF